MSSAEQVLLKMLKDAKLDGNPVAQKLVLGALTSNKPELVSRVYHLLRVPALKERVTGTPFKEPTADALAALRQWPFLYAAKALQRDNDVTYPINMLAQHSVCFGAPGMGKTMWLNAIVYQVLRIAASDILLANMLLGQRGLSQIPQPHVMIVERTKRDAQWLVKEAESAGFECIKLDERDLVHNPLEVPEGVRPETHLEETVRNFCKTNNVQLLGEAYFRQAVGELYAQFGVFHGSDDYPTLYHVLERLKSREFWQANSTGWGPAPASVKASLDSLVVKLTSFLFHNEHLYGASAGFPISQLAQTNFILDVSGFSEPHARFIVQSIVGALFEWRWERGERGRGLHNLIVADECDWLVRPRDPRYEGRDFAPIADIMSKSREVGIGFVLADQTANLDDTVFVNSALKMCFRLGDGQDMARIQRHLRLDDEQTDFIPKLGISEAVSSFPGIAPMLVRAPRMRISPEE